MNRNAKDPRQGLTARGPEVSAAGGSTTSSLSQEQAPRVAGRLDTYRSRSRKWHRQVKVERCPGCGHPHLHRAPLPLVRSVLKTGPCGLTYVVQLRVEAVTG